MGLTSRGQGDPEERTQEDVPLPPETLHPPGDKGKWAWPDTCCDIVGVVYALLLLLSFSGTIMYYVLYYVGSYMSPRVVKQDTPNVPVLLS